MAKLHHIKTEPYNKYKLKITCERRSWFKKPETQTFVGSSTVWHNFPDGNRQPTHIEAWLSDLAQRYKFQNEA